jgi:hypothetical protein
VPEVRRTLIGDMKVYNEKFDQLQPGMISQTGFEFSPMMDFAQQASHSGRRFPSEVERNVLVRDRLSNIFPADARIDDLLKIPFSPIDELDFATHTPDDTWQIMYIGSSTHGAHYVIHYSHA